MGDWMTMEEIERRFDSEYVLLEDPQMERGPVVKGGRLRWHSPSHDEVWRKARELGARSIAVLWIGKMPDDEGFLL